MEDIIAIIMIFGIPLSIIFSITYLKAKNLQLKARTMHGIDGGIVAAMQQENDELRARVENLEMIMSDSDLLKLKEFMEEEKLQDKAKRFRESY